MKDTAVVVYLDTDKWSQYEIHWLYRSWVYSRSNLRSDLLIFHDPDIDWTVLPEDDGVIYIPLPKVNDPLWRDYARINSTYFLTTPEAEITHKYLYTFKTDIDAFLTSNFATLKPRLAIFGYNCYEVEDPTVSEKIGELCRKYNIRRYHANIDCHVMAYSRNITEFAKIQYHIAKRLKTEEFQEGPGEWPGWYEYVINMYSSGLAANAFFKMGCYVGGFNCMSMSMEEIGSNDYHIHAWHTKQHFSKLKWREGYYNSIDFDALDDTIINQYCMKMAGPFFG